MSLFRLDLSATVLKFLSTAPKPRSEVVLDTPPVIVKTAQLQDLHDLSEILTFSFHDSEGWMKWLLPVMRLGIYEDLRQRITNQATHYACLVAVYSDINESGDRPHTKTDYRAAADVFGTPVGTVEISVRQRNLWQSHSKYVYLSNLAVREDYRRLGVASQLLRGCERMACRWGFHDIYLHVLDNNAQANGLYRKLGYQAEQVEGNLLTWMLNRPQQVLLHKRISS